MFYNREDSAGSAADGTVPVGMTNETASKERVGASLGRPRGYSAYRNPPTSNPSADVCNFVQPGADSGKLIDARRLAVLWQPASELHPSEDWWGVD